MTAPVLVALDPERPSAEAERLGRLLARAAGAGLVLVTVFPIIAAHGRVDTQHFERALAREADAFLAQRAAGLGEGVSTRTVGSYSAGRGLHRLAAELEAGAIVVGASHRRHAGRVLPGAMSSRLIHGAPCPVAVASRGRVPDRLRRVAVAYAPTADGDAALRAGARLAASAGATLEAIAVAAPLPWMSLVEPAFDGTTLEAEFRAHIARCVEGAVEGLQDEITAEAVTLSGDPVELIAEATAQLDLLVCGSRGHGPVGEVVLGSVSHALIEAAGCSVLVVPRP